MAVQRDDDDGEGEKVDGETRRRLDHAAQRESRPAEGPVFTQHVHSRQHHGHTEDCKEERAIQAGTHLRFIHPRPIFFLRSTHIRVDLLSYEGKMTAKQGQYDWRAEKNSDGSC